MITIAASSSGFTMRVTKNRLSEPFDKLLKQKAKKLIETYEETGTLDHKSLEELEALSALQKVYGKPHFRNRYLMLTVLALAALTLTLPLLQPIRETEIELNVHSTDVSFDTIGQPQPIIESLDFREVGFRDVALLSLSNRRPVKTLDDEPFPYQLTAKPPGRITLEQLLLPSGSTVHLTARNEVYEAAFVLDKLKPEDKLELEFELNNTKSLDASPLPPPLALTLSDGSLIVRGVPGEDIPVAPASSLWRKLVAQQVPLYSMLLSRVFPPPLKRKTQPTEILELSFSTEDDSSRLAQQTEISALAFMRAKVWSDTENTLSTFVSGIEGGNLYLEELGGRRLILRPGERLRFKEANGTLRAVHLGHGRMDIQFRGTVSGMETSSAEKPRSLMPTRLEWLQAQTSITTLLSGAVALLGAIAALLERWRSQDL